MEKIGAQSRCTTGSKLPVREEMWMRSNKNKGMMTALNCLPITFKVKGTDQTETETNGWEITGWDPDRQQIDRSWIFDSNDGFGELTWANDGEHWLIQASNVWTLLGLQLWIFVKILGLLLYRLDFKAGSA